MPQYQEAGGRENPETMNEPHFYTEMFQRWHLSLHRYLQRKHDSISPDELQAVRILEVHYQLLKMSIKIGTPDDNSGMLLWKNADFQSEGISQLAWDNHVPQFQAITNTVRDLIEHTENNIRNFALDLHVIIPLFKVATLCRDPVIRREATALLWKDPHEAGMSDSRIAALVCEMTVRIEEESIQEVRCAGDVPLWARAERIELGYNPDGRPTKVCYHMTKRPPEVGMYVREESFPW